jgi:hypothetical protein
VARSRLNPLEHFCRLSAGRVSSDGKESDNPERNPTAFVVKGAAEVNFD